MVNIEGNLNNLGILKNMPTSILSKLNISHSFLATNNDSEIEVSIISGASPSEISKIVENLNGKYVDLGYGYGIAEIPIENLVEIDFCLSTLSNPLLLRTFYKILWKESDWQK